MSNNFTPLPKTVVHAKNSVNINMVLIIIALGITILLGILMWFLVVQKQKEENRAKTPVTQTPKRTVEATVEQSEVDEQLSITPSATPSAIPTSVQATITPVASPSATTTP